MIIIYYANALLAQFISWYQLTKVSIPGKENLTCSSSKRYLVLSHIDTELLKATCFPSDIKVISLSITLTVSAVLIPLLILAVHRCRRRLQFVIMKYMDRLCHRKTKSQSQSLQDDDTQMKYDAFVSYCSADRFWVQGCLMQTLESDLYGFKLCIHYSDFPLGEDISTVIVNSIRKSRQLIIVLSKCSVT